MGEWGVGVGGGYSPKRVGPKLVSIYSSWLIRGPMSYYKFWRVSIKKMQKNVLLVIMLRPL